jgi:ubiquinone/menaquinone biosynthesis C-methylase UbiE
MQIQQEKEEKQNMMDKKQSFTGLADNYQKARPTYPQELFQTLIDNLVDVNNNDTINVLVDVGCGTGISTRLLYQSLDNNNMNVKVFGVEPGHDMRQTAIENSSDKIQYVEGSAESIPVEDSSVDIVTAAQAAHWFDRPKFYAEAKRVLKDNGIIATFENNRDHYNSTFLSKYEEFLEQHAVDPVTRQHYSRYYRELPYDQELKQSFGNHKLYEFQWTRQMSVPDFVTMTQSSSQANAARKHIGEEAFARGVTEIANEYQQDGFVQVLYKTELHLSIKK